MGRGNVLFHTLTVLVFAVGHEGLRVHGPSGPLVAQLGGSVLLPCFIESPVPLEGLQVEWRKMDSDSLVGLFQQGENRPDLQSQVFRGRVDFSRNEVLKGNFSILLKNVSEEDAGGYTCKVNTTQDSSEVVMEIRDIEHVMVREEKRTVFAHEGEDVILDCSVYSQVPTSEIEEVSWKKTDRHGDILVLLYQKRELFPDSSHEQFQGRVDLFSSEIPKGNFSLKLTNVRMEDNGEFLCEVHTRNMSARQIVVLQGIGFSALYISILALCFVALLLTVGLSVPAFNHLRKKVASRKSMIMHASLILCPNICIFFAFILWSSEGRLSEIAACSAVSIGRPIMLLKAAPYLDRLPKRLQKSVMSLAVPLYYTFIAVATCPFFFYDLTEAHTAFQHIKTVMAVATVVSVIGALVLAKFDLQIYSTLCLETFNGALVALFLHESEKYFADQCQCLLHLPMPASLPPLIMAMMMVLILQKHFFQEKPFTCLHISLTSAFVTSYCLLEMMLFVLIGITIRSFANLWMFPFEAVMYIIACLAVIVLLRSRKRGCCTWMIGYLCCTVAASFVIVAFGALCFHFTAIIIEGTKDRAGYLALTVLVHVLAATSLFKHPKRLPEFPHVMIYMFGSVGLIIVNSVVLVVELIQKAGKGLQTTGDLHGIVLSFEAVFVSAWLTLQIYDALMRLRDRIKHNVEEEKKPEVLPEMEAFSVQP